MNENKYKIIFLGDPGVGKSSIINRFSQDKFDSNYQATIGLDFHTKSVIINNKSVKLLLYDTAGQEKFRSLIPMYIRDANIIIIVYDISIKQTFANTEYWISQINDLKRDDSIIFLVGNKSDLEKKQVSFEEGSNLAKEKKLIFKEVSAKNGLNIESLFLKDIVEKLASKFDYNQNRIDDKKSTKRNGENTVDNSTNDKIDKIILDKENDHINKKKKKCC